jgi:hypothetical protein
MDSRTSNYRVHELKCLKWSFDAIIDGSKPFEIRCDDRDYGVDDHLRLMEWDPKSSSFTGREMTKRVTYVTDFAQQENYVVMGIADVTTHEPFSWQPIETAPRDGTLILTVVAGWRPGIFKWFEFSEGGGRWTPDPESFLNESDLDEWMDGNKYEPTHWMPLPVTPATKLSATGEK